MVPGWLSPKTAAVYCDVSERTMREYLKHGLRSVKVRGSVRIRKEWIDAWMETHEVSAEKVSQVVDDMVNELMEGMAWHEVD